MNYLPEKLVKIRKHYGYSQDALALKLGMDVVDYMGVENGRSILTYNQMLKLAKLCKVNVSEIINNTPDISLNKKAKADNNKANIAYFNKQSSLLYKIKKIIVKNKTKVIVGFVCAVIAIASIVIYAVKSNNVAQYIPSNNNLLDTSRTNVAYVNNNKVKLTGSINFGQDEYEDIKAIKVQEALTFTAILGEDHKVYIGGSDWEYKEAVSKLKNVVDIATGDNHLVVLLRNGKVKCFGKNNGNEETWKNIIKLFAFNNVSIGIKKDGTIECDGTFEGSGNVKNYTNIKDIDGSKGTTVVLKEDGTIEYYAVNDYYSDTKKWSDIVEVGCGDDFIIGLDAAGKVHYKGSDNIIDTIISKWENIKTIDAYNDYFVAYDGNEIYGMGNDDNNQFDKNKSLITLDPIKEITIVNVEDEILIKFDKINNASGYKVSLVTSEGSFTKSFNTNLDIYFKTSDIQNNEKCVIEITAIGEKYFLDSEMFIYEFVFEKPEEELIDEGDNHKIEGGESISYEPSFAIYHFIGYSVEDYVKYLIEYGASESNIIGEESMNPCSSIAVIESVEGYQDGEKITKSELKERIIKYKYCKVSANG